MLSSKTHKEFGDCPPEWCTVRYGIEKQAVRVRLPSASNPELANASAGHVFGTRDGLMRLAHFVDFSDISCRALLPLHPGA